MKMASEIFTRVRWSEVWGGEREGRKEGRKGKEKRVHSIKSVTCFDKIDSL